MRERVNDSHNTISAVTRSVTKTARISRLTTGRHFCDAEMAVRIAFAWSLLTWLCRFAPCLSGPWLPYARKMWPRGGLGVPIAVFRTSFEPSQGSVTASRDSRKWTEPGVIESALSVKKLTFQVRFGAESRRIGGVLGSTVFSQYATFTV